MRVTCPNCSAAYEVPDRLLAAGPRMLQCTKCAHQFSAAPTPAPAAPEAPPAPPRREEAPATAAETAAPPPEKPNAPPPAPPSLTAPLIAASQARKTDRGAVLGWVATLGLLAVSGVLIAANEARIIAAWPPAERFFDWIRQGVSAIQSI